MKSAIDILLINPISWGEKSPSYLPYGLLFLAGFLRSKGFEVKIYDRNVDRRNLEKVLEEYNPDLAGISVLTGPVINDAVYISKKIKSIKDIPLIWGGIHPTIFPQHVLKKEYIDYVILGEGELPLLELSNYLLKGAGKPENIDNLGFKKNGQIKINKIRDFIDLNTLPLPAWDLIEIEKYVQSKFYSDRVITLNTSRGCPYRCAYCYNQAVNNRRWRGVSPERIIQYIDHLQQKFGIKGFQMYDDSFDVNKGRIRDLCNLIISRQKNIYWQHFSKVNFVNIDLLRLEKKAGLRFIEYGIESGSERLLNFIDKDQTVSMIKNAYSICREIGLDAGALFMVGMPTETLDEVNQTVNLVSSLKTHQTITTIFRPYPATKLYDYCVENNLFRLPADIEEQGRIYALGDTEVNVSLVPVKYLQMVMNNFAFNNIKNEILSCIRYSNYSLLLYYIRNKFNLRQIKRLIAGLSGYLSLNLKKGLKEKGANFN
jgi:anaerobic magnesium-protoporphyrin IX monomethyl ester cyclase